MLAGMIRFALYPLIAAVVGFIVGILVIGSTLSYTGISALLLLCVIVIFFIGLGILVAYLLNKKDGGVITSSPPHSPDGPFMDLGYLWSYLRPQVKWSILIMFIMLFGSFLFGWAYGITVNYLNLTIFYIIFGTLAACMPYAKGMQGPSAVLLFPSSSDIVANVLNMIFMCMCFAFSASILIWAYTALIGFH